MKLKLFDNDLSQKVDRPREADWLTDNGKWKILRRVTGH